MYCALGPPTGSTYTPLPVRLRSAHTEAIEHHPKGLDHLCGLQRTATQRLGMTARRLFAIHQPATERKRNAIKHTCPTTGLMTNSGMLIRYTLHHKRTGTQYDGPHKQHRLDLPSMGITPTATDNRTGSGTDLPHWQARQCPPNRAPARTPGQHHGQPYASPHTDTSMRTRAYGQR